MNNNNMEGKSMHEHQSLKFICCPPITLVCTWVCARVRVCVCVTSLNYIMKIISLAALTGSTMPFPYTNSGYSSKEQKEVQTDMRQIFYKRG